MERRLRAVIRGYVQGVGYRVFAAREARRLGLTGWVRNRSDGAVELCAEGSDERLREYLTLLQKGPAEAEVASVDEEWSLATRDGRTFEIRH